MVDDDTIQVCMIFKAYFSKCLCLLDGNISSWLNIVSMPRTFIRALDAGGSVVLYKRSYIEMQQRYVYCTLDTIYYTCRYIINPDAGIIVTAFFKS